MFTHQNKFIHILRYIIAWGFGANYRLLGPVIHILFGLNISTNHRFIGHRLQHLQNIIIFLFDVLFI